MRIITEFDLNDKVYKIDKKRESGSVSCSECGGSNYHMIGNSRYKCKNCNNGTVMKEFFEYWYVKNQLTIKQVRIVKQNDYKEVRYMCQETGVGSGTLHKQKDLFLFQDEALEECRKRNKKLSLENDQYELINEGEKVLKKVEDY